MRYVVTKEEMQALDKRTSEQYHMEPLVLMERAAYELAACLREKKPQPCRVLVLAGCGNNGGDGFAAGRILWQAGYQVEFFLAGSKGRCSDLCKKQLNILQSYGISVKTDREGTDISGQNEYDIIIDALFGVGLSRSIEGETAELIEQVNKSGAYVVACDLPSGICADTGQVLGCSVQADLTVTFAFYKRGLLLYPGALYAGEVRLVPMGITEHSFMKTASAMGEKTTAFTYDRKDLRRLPARRQDGNKGSFGKILLVAGSPDMAGAAIFAGKTCYRMGAGMVRIFTAGENRIILQTALPEAVLHTYDGADETGEDSCREGIMPGRMKEKAPSAEGLLQSDLAWADCIIIGPGLGRSKMAQRWLQKLFCDNVSKSKTYVIDADALNLLSEDRELQGALVSLAKENEIILTPHLMEFSRLTHKEISILKQDIIANVIECAGALGVTVVCKDACTVVADKTGRVYLNRSGNDALATAGAGDVLTGVIGGLTGAGMSGFDAAVLGVYLHGLAGEQAAKKSSRYSVMAGDLPGALSEVLHMAVTEKEALKSGGRS